MIERATMEGVLQVVRPGEKISYLELVARMKVAGLSTVGVGIVVTEAKRFGPYAGEIMSWAEPIWDDEVTGGWTDGSLWLKRRPAHNTGTEPE